MSKIFKLLSFKNKWPSKLSSRFSWSRLQINRKRRFFNWFDKVFSAPTSSTNCPSRAINHWARNPNGFSKDPMMWDASAHETNLCEGLTSGSMKGRCGQAFRSINYVQAFKSESILHVIDVIGDWLRCRNAFKVQTTTTDLLQYWSAAESGLRIMNWISCFNVANYVYRQNPVSVQWSHARTSDDFSIFQTGCSTEDNLRSIYKHNSRKFQLKTGFHSTRKHFELENNLIRLKYIC